MKLWLDDIRPAPPGYDIIAKTANEAITHLVTGKITEMSFDHDLGDLMAGTGYTVARWLELAAYTCTIPRIKWAIHSANPVGRKNIEVALINADRYWDECEEYEE